jgi:hypothetical protein
VSGLLGPRTLLAVGGFLFLGTVAATFFALAGRPATPPSRRRLYGALWVLVLLVGGPLWLVAAAGLGLF